jgi:beta-alanine degradation protein BauB
MNRSWKHAVAAGIVVVSALALRGMAQDRATVVPGMKVLLEHECVRVQYHDVAVGQTVPMHSHPNYVVYTLADFKARIRLEDGTERISQRKAGEAYWNEPIAHSVENLGEIPIHNLIVELKRGAASLAVNDTPRNGLARDDDDVGGFAVLHSLRDDRSTVEGHRKLVAGLLLEGRCQREHHLSHPDRGQYCEFFTGPVPSLRISSHEPPPGSLALSVAPSPHRAISSAR